MVKRSAAMRDLRDGMAAPGNTGLGHGTQNLPGLGMAPHGTHGTHATREVRIVGRALTETVLVNCRPIGIGDAGAWPGRPSLIALRSFSMTDPSDDPKENGSPRHQGDESSVQSETFSTDAAPSIPQPMALPAAPLSVPSTPPMLPGEVGTGSVASAWPSFVRRRDYRH
ncbi:MAG: hypothetical protein IH987_02195 [Planctomycetes bacterium]|nr:hypothetical protein [Planctomycetota bacterium]